MNTIVLYNSLKEHSVKIENCKFDACVEEDRELLDDLCNAHIEENGFYEVDIWNNHNFEGEDDCNEENDFFLIFLNDDDPNWKENFDDVVEKLKTFVY